MTIAVPLRRAGMPERRTRARLVVVDVHLVRSWFLFRLSHCSRRLFTPPPPPHLSYLLTCSFFFSPPSPVHHPPSPIPPGRRVACCAFQGSELTPAAEAAFTEIFSRHSVNGGMDIRTMVSTTEALVPLAGRPKVVLFSGRRPGQRGYATVSSAFAVRLQQYST